MERVPRKAVSHVVIWNNEFVTFHGMVKIYAVEERGKLDNYLLVFRKELVSFGLVSETNAIEVLVDCVKMHQVPHKYQKPHFSNIFTPTSQKRSDEVSVPTPVKAVNVVFTVFPLEMNQLKPRFQPVGELLNHIVLIV